MGKTYRSLSAAILLSLTFLTAHAETVSPSKAQRAAQSFFSGSSLTKTSASTTKLVWDGIETKGTGDAPFYIFNAGDEGFVIIAGDDGMNPVLGYSTDSAFDSSDIPDGLMDLFECYRRNINDLRQKTIEPAHGVSEKWGKLLSPTKAGISATTVVNLKTAPWGQRNPYKRKCPEIHDTVCITGCGATALSILMRYYKKPDKGYGTLESYTTTTHKYVVPEKELGYAYQWDDMLETYKGVSATKEQKNAVATIMADAGQMIYSDYRPTLTTSNFASFLPGMLSHMKYSDKAVWRQHFNFSTDEWMELLKKEMDAGHPVIYRGAAIPEGGHFYIIDGYDSEGRFHFNWGWNGNKNGFYYIADTRYSCNESAIFGLVPDDNWTEPTTISELSYFCRDSTKQYPKAYYGIWADKAYINKGDNVTIYVDVINRGTTVYSGDVKICIRHFDKKVDDLDVPTSNIPSLKQNFVQRLVFEITSFPTITDGDAIISYYKVGSDWVPVDDGIRAIPLRYEIPDVVSLVYGKNKTQRYLELNGMAGMTLTIGGESPITFTTPKLKLINPTGTADYTINNGHDNYTVHLTFPEED